jgi:tRNA pseudouridine13 synthase
MKVKRLAEDFAVEELTDLAPGAQGDFALYRLTKRSLGTLEAVEAIQQRWNIPRRRMSWGGLKDKHAATTQFLTIHRGSARSLRQTGLSLEFVGRLDRHFTPADIRGNRFAIVLRSLSEDDVQRAIPALEQVRRDGLPNYFDDQRFGSLTAGGEFIAEPWIRGNYERALWLTFAEPSPFDRSDERTQKEILRANWGNFLECKRLLAKSHRRSIVTFLVDRPGDFRGAWARVDQDLRSLYLAAFQSQLWNELLAALLRQHCDAARLVEIHLKTGPLPFFTQLDEAVAGRLRDALLPLPTARTRIDSIEDPDLRQLVEQTLTARGLAMREIRVKYPRDSFSSKGWRKAIVRPDELTWEVGDDDLHSGRTLLRLRFDLPRGSYATILVKRITRVGVTPSVEDFGEPEAGDESSGGPIESATDG